VNVSLPFGTNPPVDLDGCVLSASERRHEERVDDAASARDSCRPLLLYRRLAARMHPVNSGVPQIIFRTILNGLAANVGRQAELIRRRCSIRLHEGEIDGQP
jgi:hypothetical protein